MSPTIGAVRSDDLSWFFVFCMGLNVAHLILQTNFLSVHRVLGTL